MTTQSFKRKLTAILSADVKGYRRLMGEDEEGTIRTLNAYKEAMTGFIQKHQGRVVGTAGDSVLAEFASVVDAVRCAVEIQNELKTRNADLPDNRRMEFRIGVNLGDVVEEGDTIATKSKPTRPFRSGRGPRGSPGPRLSTPPFKGGASSGRTGEALEILQGAGRWRGIQGSG